MRGLQKFHPHFTSLEEEWWRNFLLDLQRPSVTQSGHWPLELLNEFTPPPTEVRSTSAAEKRAEQVLDTLIRKQTEEIEVFHKYSTVCTVL